MLRPPLFGFGLSQAPQGDPALALCVWRCRSSSRASSKHVAKVVQRLFASKPKKLRRRHGNCHNLLATFTYLAATIEIATAEATRTSLADVPRWCLGTAVCCWRHARISDALDMGNMRRGLTQAEADRHDNRRRWVVRTLRAGVLFLKDS